MEFRIADKFIESHARLTVDEQKLVKTTAFKLQLNPASSGIRSIWLRICPKAKPPFSLYWQLEPIRGHRPDVVAGQLIG